MMVTVLVGLVLVKSICLMMLDLVMKLVLMNLALTFTGMDVGLFVISLIEMLRWVKLIL